ncbi:MAG TPA: SpoIIE family protein phosphatase [Syntrophales bacterium]|jgi:sigma-B regulation protein RsbU (phosphoserine phosphatase)|nr:SpoIIE family protein phosphatase [Syntrophales bacterium]HON23388.1 SpoIIE family protein phosphatase [Syntrophales bacterium]HOU77596.1 SpoIIE family protein phosphatase [Syntrophales bacterium]HPC32391.1 SpoIIE family protein phosphatase [Syntrophales bacterium]HQG34620.1 SpoIIE family protein phosphatase [Syntrophales bacterium]
MAATAPLKDPRFRIRTKMLLVLLGISIVPLIVFGTIARQDLEEVSRYTITASNAIGERASQDSAQALEDLGARMIRQKAIDVALQCAIFLRRHPGVPIERFQTDKEFQQIAVQSVGSTGYTIVFDRQGVMRFHPNPELINYDMHNWREMLPGFWALFEQSFDGSSGGGFYNWQDSDRVIRRKFMYIAPIKGTPYMVAATTYIDEFSRPAEETKQRIATATANIRGEINKSIQGINSSFLAIMAAMLLIVAAISFLLSRMITNPILALMKGARAIGRVEMEHTVEVKTGDELEVLADSFNNMARNLKLHMEDLKCTTAEKERLQKELEIARGIQLRLLPQHPPYIEGFDLAANNLPAQEIGGDFYDYIPVSLDSWGLIIADVSGKGMPAAIFMGLSRTIVRASATDNPSAAAAIRQANELICRDSTSGMFVTLFYAILDARERKLRYVNAGHNPPLLFRNGSGEVISLRTRGIALGVAHFIDLQEAEKTLEPGDLVVFYTDGVTEAINEHQEAFGERRLIEIVSRNRQLSARELISKVEEAVMVFAGRETQFDDITMLVLKVL